MVQMDPCCGGSLQRGTKIVAIVEMVLSILTTIGALTLLLLSVWAISALSKDKSTSIQDSGHSLGNLPPNHSTDAGGDVTVLKVLIAASSGTLIVGIFGLVVSIILLKGSNQRNLRKCRVWFIIKCILMVAELAIFLVSVSSEPKGEQAVSLISIALGAYCMCVVFAFMKELREEQAALGTPKNFYKA